MSPRRVVREAVDAWRTRPFDWQEGSCLAWVGYVAERLTGRDPTTELRACFRTEQECLRGMVERGWRTYGDAAASVATEIPISMARTGDWVYCVDDQDNHGLGVVHGHLVAIRTRDGIGVGSLRWAKRAFRVTEE